MPIRKLRKIRRVKALVKGARGKSFLAHSKLGRHRQTADDGAEPTPERIMKEVNKFIFVQDFERASAMLSSLSRRFVDNYEIHFRRIEVACHHDDIESVHKEYETRRKENPSNIAVTLAATLAEIRLLDRNDSTVRHGDELINPSFGASGDVVGLSMSSEELIGGAPVQVRSGARHLVLPRNHDGDSPAKLRGKNIHIDRTPIVADDAVPLDLSLQPESYVDDVKPESRIPDEMQKYPALARAVELTQSFPDNYAAWYVAGCAYEFVGDLNRAIFSWKKASSLQPNSISVLATMAELQQIGALSSEDDFAARFEALDKNLVHGSYETHTELYKEFIARGEYRQAIAALRTLADWIQRQRGDVPAEIEILCLLGAMRAYSLEGNASASEACRREVERLVIACKKSPRNATQLCFVAQICEEYGLKNLAKILYLAVLTSPDTSTELVVRIAAHTVTTAASPALRECLKVSYRNTNGHPEIRFCQLLCNLFLSNVPIERYMKRKGEIRELVTKSDVGQAFNLLSECLKETNEDPEVHFYMGDLYSRLGVFERAREHFETMYELDYLNSDSVIRYVGFLLKAKSYSVLKEVTRRAMDIPNINEQQLADLYWARCIAAIETSSPDEAKKDIESALKISPWNRSYLYLMLRIFENEYDVSALPSDKVTAGFLQANEKDVKEFSDEFVRDWLLRAQTALSRGYVDYGFVMAKCALLMKPKSSEVIKFFARSGAAFDSRYAVQQLLMLSSIKTDVALQFNQLALICAQVYGESGEWALVNEWIDISERSGVESKIMRAKIFELQALSLAMTNTQIKKAQNLVEAAIDSLDGTTEGPSRELLALHGYLLVVQGETRAGLEKLQMLGEHAESILVLYFVIKGLERANRLEHKAKGPLAEFFKFSPSNSLELRLLEEIYCTLGIRSKGTQIHLAS